MLGVLMAMYGMFFLHEPRPGQELRLITYNRISFVSVIPLSYESRIRAIPGVREVMAYQWFGGVYKDARDPKNTFARFAVEPDKLFTIHPDYRLSDAERIAFQRERDACIVGRTLAQQLGFKIGDHITIKGDIFPATLEFIVRGIYDSAADNESLFFHFDYLNEAVFKGNQNFVSMYAIMADRADAVTSVAHAIDDTFRNSTAQTKTESEQGFLLSVISYLGNVKMFLLAVCAALTMTVLLVSANTMAMSVRERVAEVGILKTLGFTRENVLTLIVGEALVIALVGGGIGFWFATALVMLMRGMHAGPISMHSLTVSPLMALAGALLAAVVGIASSAVPAWSASRRGIIDCLRLAD
jgi:putative ABC transport system permease protein